MIQCRALCSSTCGGGSVRRPYFTKGWLRGAAGHGSAAAAAAAKAPCEKNVCDRTRDIEPRSSEPPWLPRRMIDPEELPGRRTELGGSAPQTPRDLSLCANPGEETETGRTRAPRLPSWPLSGARVASPRGSILRPGRTPFYPRKIAGPVAVRAPHEKKSKTFRKDVLDIKNSFREGHPIHSERDDYKSARPIQSLLLPVSAALRSRFAKSPRAAGRACGFNGGSIRD